MSDGIASSTSRKATDGADDNAAMEDVVMADDTRSLSSPFTAALGGIIDLVFRRNSAALSASPIDTLPVPPDITSSDGGVSDDRPHHGLKSKADGDDDGGGEDEDEEEEDPAIDVKGKTCLVTGASSGLGYAVAMRLAGHGARLILACRSGIPRVRDEIVARYPKANVTMLHVDLCDIHSIHTYCDQVRDMNVTLDVIVFNAGLMPSSTRVHPTSGLEEMFTVNYLAKVIQLRRFVQDGVLCVGTTPAQRNQGIGADEPGGSSSSDSSRSSSRSSSSSSTSSRTKCESKPRIICVSSETHRTARPLDAEGVGSVATYGLMDGVGQYGYSKALLTTFSMHASRCLNSQTPVEMFLGSTRSPTSNGSDAATTTTTTVPSRKAATSISSRNSTATVDTARNRTNSNNVSVFTICPGAVNSNMARESPWWIQPLLFPVMNAFFQSPDTAALPVVSLCGASVLEGHSGYYYHMDNKKEPSPQASSAFNGQTLYDCTVELLERVYARVGRVEMEGGRRVCDGGGDTTNKSRSQNGKKRRLREEEAELHLPLLPGGTRSSPSSSSSPSTTTSSSSPPPPQPPSSPPPSLSSPSPSSSASSSSNGNRRKRRK
eukprot:TRINITY_DN2515_c3_g1_i1.p1 TRINITY_DN2515_c3_g1~~TRINITY_DN2515_c3_g1_i1.p1  ORF type:complete len:604 (+),score=164.39 TRINITY_DN2515_c3_g1_i1:73-1884(+)